LPFKRPIDTAVFGWIALDALSSLKLPLKAKTVSRKVKILCLCQQCTNRQALCKSIKNRTGVVCIQLKKYSKYQKQSKTTGSQTDTQIDVEESRFPIFCNFRKLIGIKRPIAVRESKEIAIQCSNEDKISELYEQSKESPEAKRKKIKCKEISQNIVEKGSLNQAKRRHRKVKSKSLLKYVLKREALKSLQTNNRHRISLENNLKNFRLKMKRLLHLQKRTCAPSKIPHFEKQHGRTVKLKKHNLKNYKLLPMPIYKQKMTLHENNSNHKQELQQNISISKLVSVNKPTQNKSVIKLKSLGHYFVKKQKSIASADQCKFPKICSHGEILRKLQAFFQQFLG